MRPILAIALLAASLAGCGTLPGPQAGTNAVRGALVARADTPIFNLPGVQVGVSMKLAGQYKSVRITGSGQLDALDSQHMAMSATVTGKVLFVTQTKHVTMAVTRSQDANWPYAIQAVNETDNVTYQHQAKLASQTPDGLTSTFTLDDGTSSVIAADGHGNFKVAYGDFNLVVGNSPSLLLKAPRLNNRPTHELLWR